MRIFDWKTKNCLTFFLEFVFFGLSFSSRGRDVVSWHFEASTVSWHFEASTVFSLLVRVCLFWEFVFFGKRRAEMREKGRKESEEKREEKEKRREEKRREEKRREEKRREE